MTQQPPRRLLDDPSFDARMRQDLANSLTARAPYDVDAGLVALSTGLDGLTSSSIHPAAADMASAAGGHAGSATTWSVLGVKWWGLSAVGLATLGAVWWTQTEPPAPGPSTTTSAAAVSPALAESEPQSPEPAVEAAARARATPPQPPALERQPSTEVGPPGHSLPTRTRSSTAGSTDEPVTHRTSAPTASRARAARQASTLARARTPHTAPSVEPPTTRPRAASAPAETKTQHPPAATPREKAPADEEVEQLALARRVLASNPARALQILETGQQQFASGIFGEERAALVVFALEALGRRQEVVSAARRFLQSYPSGPFAARVRRLQLEQTKAL